MLCCAVCRAIHWDVAGQVTRIVTVWGIAYQVCCVLPKIQHGPSELIHPSSCLSCANTAYFLW